MSCATRRIATGISTSKMVRALEVGTSGVVLFARAAAGLLELAGRPVVWRVKGFGARRALCIALALLPGKVRQKARRLVLEEGACALGPNSKRQQGANGPRTANICRVAALHMSSEHTAHVDLGRPRGCLCVCFCFFCSISGPGPVKTPGGAEKKRF